MKKAGLNDLCNLHIYQGFMNYVNQEKVEILKCIKALLIF